MVTTIAPPAPDQAPPRQPSAIRRWLDRSALAVAGRGGEALRQLALITVLYLAYRVGRIVTADSAREAFKNADSLWSLERRLHLPTETAVQGWFVHRPYLALPANFYYATAHFTVAVVALLWLWMYRPAFYRWTRNVMVGLTATAFLLEVLLPMAPPRMLPDLGFVDLAAKYGQSVYGPTATDRFANQFAAMPSLHVGWAVLLAGALILATKTRWRWLLLLHPIITVIVVVGTGNHFWLDGAVAILLTAAAVAFAAETYPGGAAPDSLSSPDRRPAALSSPMQIRYGLLFRLAGRRSVRHRHPVGTERRALADDRAAAEVDLLLRERELAARE